MQMLLKQKQLTNNQIHGIHNTYNIIVPYSASDSYLNSYLSDINGYWPDIEFNDWVKSSQFSPNWNLMNNNKVADNWTAHLIDEVQLMSSIQPFIVYKNTGSNNSVEYTNQTNCFFPTLHQK